MNAIILLLHCATALFCGLECILALADLRGRFPKLLMFASLGLIHGVTPALTPSNYYLASFSANSRLHAAGLAFVGVVLFSAGWRLFEAYRPKVRGLSGGLLAVVESPAGQALLRRLFWICAVVGVVAWMVSVISMGYSLTEVFRRGRFQHRGLEEFYVSAIAQYFVVLSILPGFLCFFMPRAYRPLGVAYALAMALFLFLASQGSRANSMGLLGALMMGYTLRHRVAAHRVLAIGGAVAIFLLLSVALYDVRRSMARQSVGEMLTAVASPETYRDALLRDPLNYHLFLIAAVEYFPDRHPFLNGATYRRMLVFFLPRRYFPELKPADPNMTFAEVVDPHSATALTTIPPTMMGDGYINFWGWPGVLIMFANGLAFGYAHWKMRTSVLWFIVAGSMFVRIGLLGVRGQPYETLIMGVWTLAAVWILGRFCGFPFRESRRLTEGSLPAIEPFALHQRAGGY
jgi:hypothetical protein